MTYWGTGGGFGAKNAEKSSKTKVFPLMVDLTILTLEFVLLVQENPDSIPIYYRTPPLRSNCDVKEELCKICDFSI